MSLSTVTSAELLAGLKDVANRTVWQGYVDRYRPLLVAYARRLGLAASDAEDVAQDALLAFASEYRAGKYDPSRGRLRDWLFGIARMTLRGWRRRERRRPRPAASGVDGEDVLAAVPDEDRLSQLWEEEWRKAVVRACLDEVRREVEPTTYRAFELFACEGRPALEVGEELGISQNAVFLAKQRVLRRLRELHPSVEEVF